MNPSTSSAWQPAVDVDMLIRRPAAEVWEAFADPDQTSGFVLVLASLKMWLEHGIEGELMYDKFPDAEYADR